QEILVDRSKFFPIPNVDSLVFSLTKKQEKNIDFAGFLYKIAKICFQNRRKTIFNNLTSFIKNKDTMRAEELKTADFIRLAEKIKETTIE
ncbi:rRNA adenine N-6-methyltransferase family protein, partial [Lactobacillus kitasatonis]|uniref:rRNA adenine N-6-methyltransferase family protein n=1 Tax=Lactobacillus kitasatonis TaxID=237446 RepID=UPI0026F211AC